MKTIGIAMLFGLCTMIGVRLAAKKTERLHTVRSLRSELRLFSERTALGCGTLCEFAAERNGILSELLRIYLKALTEGDPEPQAAERATACLRAGTTMQAATQSFLNGLSGVTRIDLEKRTQAFSTVLERAEHEAESDAKQARVLRISGVLAGAGLAILLL